MKELVEVIAKALVDNPDEVVVTEKQRRESYRCRGSCGSSLTWAKSSASREELPRQSVRL